MIKYLILIVAGTSFNMAFSQANISVATLQDAVVHIERNFFKPTYKPEQDTLSAASFIDQFQYFMAYHSRIEWGVLGGEEFYENYKNSIEPQNLGILLSAAYYHKNVSEIEDAMSLVHTISDTIQHLPFKKPKTQPWKFKVRDGLQVENLEFYIESVETTPKVDDKYVGMLFKPNLLAAIISLKEESVEESLIKYFNAEAGDKNKIPVKMQLNQMYAEISVTGESKPKMAVVLDLKLISPELEMEYKRMLSKDTGMVYTGAELNKLFEQLFSEMFSDFNSKI